MHRRPAHTLHTIDGAEVITLAPKNIWDGADLCMVRDALTPFVVARRPVGIDLSGVLHLPSGLFGLLADWLDRGCEVRLLGPTERVRAMLWFREFVVPDGDAWRLHAPS